MHMDTVLVQTHQNLMLVSITRILLFVSPADSRLVTAAVGDVAAAVTSCRNKTRTGETQVGLT